MMVWTKCNERMPPSGEFVLAFVRSGEWTRRIRAFYAEKFSVEASADADDWIDYNEEKDEYYVPPGWYETNEYEENHWYVTDPVTHWMPLPEAPDA